MRHGHLGWERWGTHSAHVAGEMAWHRRLDDMLSAATKAQGAAVALREVLVQRRKEGVLRKDIGTRVTSLMHK